MHFLDDRHALVQPGPGHGQRGVPDDAMLAHLAARHRALAAAQRLHGRPRDPRAAATAAAASPRRLGSLHLHDVRSFEKLTAGGVTCLDVDVIRVLEEVMPRRFGGRPADWQLVERLDGDRARPAS